MNNTPLPTDGLFVRLGPSSVQGVGVFAILDIPEGTNIFHNDQLGMCWVDRKIVEDNVEDLALLKMYTDFCVLKDGKFGCPINFNSMSMAWYINEPLPGEEPNTRGDSNYDFFAVKDIKKGDELTAWYSEYSDEVNRY